MSRRLPVDPALAVAAVPAQAMLIAVDDSRCYPSIPPLRPRSASFERGDRKVVES